MFYSSVFQSTPPVKAATIAIGLEKYIRIISIHAAREGGDTFKRPCNRFIKISIHAAREGGDGIIVIILL